jgi:hypothetical protein
MWGGPKPLSFRFAPSSCSVKTSADERIAFDPPDHMDQVPARLDRAHHTSCSFGLWCNLQASRSFTPRRVESAEMAGLLNLVNCSRIAALIARSLCCAKKRRCPRAVIDFVPRQFGCDDLVGLSVQTNVQFAAGSACLGAVFFHLPFAKVTWLKRFDGSAAELSRDDATDAPAILPRRKSRPRICCRRQWT